MKKKVSIVLIVLSLSSCQFGRFVWYNFSNITDYTIFPKRDLQASSQPFYFQKNPRITMDSITFKGKLVDFDEFMEDNKTVAFLIIRADTILFERYYAKYDSASIIASFSMAKSYTSA